MSTNFDDFKNDYSEELDKSISFSGQDSDFFTERKAHIIVEIAKRHLGETANLQVLDLGSGTGVTDSFLTPHMTKLSGAEVSPGVIETASTRNPTVSYRIYDGLTLPFDNATFDLVFTICVVHHVPVEKRELFFSEMRRVTKPGGINIVFEHNPFNPLTQHVVNNCPFDKDAVLLKPSEVRSRLRKAGLEMAEQAYFLFFPWRGAFTKKVENFLGWLPLGGQYFVVARV